LSGFLGRGHEKKHTHTGIVSEMPLPKDAVSNGIHATLQLKPFQVFPYSIEKTANQNDVLPIQSLPKIDYQDANGKIHYSVDIGVDNHTVCQVQQDGLQVLVVTLLQLGPGLLAKMDFSAPGKESIRSGIITRTRYY
jgi:hypothetical protein